ncbi:peptidoglycan-binding domain-containing protein [Streptomyces sp. RFCAC02]|uniref:peptidoglycan-binding domain-containing protein n=1 Tax=Streptomyces sp. RFCAC02 TaxID=2499143 RepID=UPI00101F54C0|nr:peptidoglycan-binding domain-containing protein [Streptomyces sp. RFCAC02]
MKRFVTVLTTAVLAAGGVLTISPAHAAAYPTCNGSKGVTYSGGDYVVNQPYYTGTGSRNCVLGYGAQGTAVRRLQDVLINCYGDLYDDGIDGIYGPNTQAAVEAVQRREGASVDGEYGPETRREMRWVVHGPSGVGCAYPRL